MAGAGIGPIPVGKALRIGVGQRPTQGSRAHAVRLRQVVDRDGGDLRGQGRQVVADAGECGRERTLTGDQVADDARDVPVLARCRAGPVVGPEARHECGEGRLRPGEVVEVHATTVHRGADGGRGVVSRLGPGGPRTSTTVLRPGAAVPAL